MDFFTWLEFIFVKCVDFLSSSRFSFGISLFDVFFGTMFVYFITKIVKGVFSDG